MEGTNDLKAVSGPGGRHRARIESRLLAAGQDFSFFQAVRLIEAAARADAGDSAAPSVGDRTRPRYEPVRLATAQGLHFPETEIAFAKRSPNDRFTLSALIMGLTGPTGVLPDHYSSYVMRQQRTEGDALADFLDLFHHRSLSLFYRAWKKYRPSNNSEADGATGGDPISGVVAAACGLYGKALRERTGVRDVALFSYAGQLSRRADPEGLASLLRDAIGQPVTIKPFVCGWIAIAEDERTRLTAGREGWSVIGSSAVIGTRHWDAQRKFRVVVGPAPFGAFRELLPGGRLHRRAVDLTRLAVGAGLDFDFDVRIARSDAPPLQLGGSDARLGWSTWLPQGVSRETLCGAILPSKAAIKRNDAASPSSR